MNVGRFEYDMNQERWIIVNDNGDEIQELHCGDVVDVRPYDDEYATWLPVRIEMNRYGYYMVTPDRDERDDFDLLDVRI